MLFNLVFASISILLCTFLFSFIFDLIFFNSAAIAQIFNPTVEPAMTIEIPMKEAKVEIKTHPVMPQTTHLFLR